MKKSVFLRLFLLFLLLLTAMMLLSSCKSGKNEKPIDLSEDEREKSFSELLKEGTDFSLRAKEIGTFESAGPAAFFTDGKTGYIVEDGAIRIFTEKNGVGGKTSFDCAGIISGCKAADGLVFLTKNDGVCTAKTVDPKTFSEKSAHKLFFDADAISPDTKTGGYYLVDGTEKIVLLDENFEDRDIYAGIGGDYTVFGAFVSDSYLCVGQYGGGDVLLWIYENGAYKTCVDFEIGGIPIGIGMFGGRIAVCAYSENNCVISTLIVEY